MKKLGWPLRAVSLGVALLVPFVAICVLVQRTIGQPNNPVAVISAASFAPQVAPESIAAAFGTRLATRTEAATGLPLPTALAGTTVRLNGQLAPLFFVSPSQINLLVPAGIAAGTANIEVTAGDGTVSRGAVQVTRAAPALFTANASGSGVPAAVALRVKADGSQSTEPVADFAQSPFLPRPLELGAASDQLFLILFGTGIRGRASLSDVAVRIGGVNAVVSYAGEVGGFAGLDQVNVLLPRELQGRGRVNLALNINGFGAANLVEVELAGAASVAPPRVTGYSAATVLAGQTLTINGSGFSPGATENLVRIGGTEARVLAASATQLTVRVPFGATAGAVTVRTPTGEGQGAQPLQMRTSVSGVVEDTRRQPLGNVKVRAVEAGVEATTGVEGSFILPDVPPSLAQTVEIDGSSVLGTLPFPKLRLRLRVLANRDNQLAAPVALQQVSGPSVQVGNAGSASPLLAKTAGAAQQAPAQSVRVGDVVFEIPAGASVSLPTGGAVNTLNLTLVENARTPVNLPAGLFSATIPQLTPFGAVLLPGGKLTLPNNENYPAGAPVKLFRFEQAPDSPMLGQFVEAATAVVSADGRRIETAPNAITEITQYFAALPRQTTTVVGRVVDSDGVTPVRQALARCRGQETFTDGNGGFVLRGVVVNAGDTLSVEASFVRANGRVDRTQRSGVPAVEGGLTVVTPDLVLPAEESNRAPVILAPTSLRINERETRNLDFVASDPDAGQTIQLAFASPPPFVTLIERGNGVYRLRFQTGANDAGTYTLMLTASDNLNLSTTLNIALTVNRLPLANTQSVTTEEDTSKAITLQGSDPDGDPLNFVIVSNPSRGRLSGTPPNLVYRPNENYNGTDSFSFKVNDGLADSNVATVSLIVTPVNDPPVLVGVPEQRMLDVGQTLNLTLNASDVDEGQTLVFSYTNLPGGASFTPLTPTAAQFSWTPSETQFGDYPISFRVTDNGTPPLSDTKTLTITVSGRWRQTAGPEGGRINALLLNGPFLFAGTEGGGVFRSSNQGQSWTPVNNGLGDRYVHALIVSGTNLFAGVDGGAFSSADNGESWKPAGRGLEGNSVYSFAVSGSNLFAATFAGVFRSTDQGQNWRLISTGLPSNTFLRALTVSDANLFVSAEARGVFRSSDQGQSWVAVNMGLPVLAIDSLTASGTNLFAVARNNGVYRSTDQGQSWAPVTNNGISTVYVNVVQAVGMEVLAGAATGLIFRTTNQGESWTNISLPVRGGGVLSLAASGANYFAGVYGGGVFRSTDQGRNWTQSNFGLNSSFVRALATNGPFLVAGLVANGAALSLNNGQSWVQINTGFTYDSVNALLFSGGNLFAGANDGVFVSTNNGSTWTRINEGLPNTTNSLLADGDDLFAGTLGSGVFRSTNQGRTWTPANAGMANTTVSALLASGGLFAGTNGNGIFLSTNRGESWTPVNTGLTDLHVTALAAIGQNLFAGTADSGVFRLSNQGQTWTPVNTGLTNRNVTALLANGSNLFAATAGGGVFMSTNQGQSWTAINAGLTDLSVYSLAISGGNLFAGTYANGVFVRPL